tara:strand:+ start:2464 stop:3315 length:852 start_codon:yes stop_codon:yes gene_type:complete
MTLLEHPVITPDDIVEIEKLDELAESIRVQAQQMGPQEVRFLVDTYYQLQQRRIGSANQERSVEKTEEPVAMLNFIGDLDKHYERKVLHMLQAYAQNTDEALWAMSITGIGPVLAAGLASHIDITKAPTAGHIWRFAGLDPTLEWNKGERRPFNAKLKTLCWKIGESFIKVQNRENDVYGKVYAERKLQEQERNEAGMFADQAKAKLEKYKIGKTTEAYKAYSVGKLPPAHINARARRFAIKLFLAHYQHVAYELHYGEPPPKPYVIEHLGHAHYIAPPNWPM